MNEFTSRLLRYRRYRGDHISGGRPAPARLARVSLAARCLGWLRTLTLALGLTASFSGASVAQMPPILSFENMEEGLRTRSPFEVRVSHTTPAYVSLDVPRSVTLLYSSELAAATAFVEVDAINNSAVPAEKLSISLRDPSGGLVWLTGGRTENFYTASAAATRIAAQFDANHLNTGEYIYSLVVRAWWGTRYEEFSTPVRVMIVNEKDSPFGAGWTLAGLQRLWDPGDGILLQEGDGTLLWFPRNQSGSHDSPAGDFTRVDWTGTQWRRTYPDGTELRFEPTSGQLLSVRDRFGNETSYAYQAGRLQTITDPAGKQITFGYDAAGKLATITDPGARVTQVQVDGAGDLARITDPDGVASLQASYDDRHRLLARSDRLGARWDLAYDAAGQLGSEAMPTINTGSGPVRPVHRFVSWRAALLPSAGRGDFLRPSTQILPGAARAEIRDAKGNVTRMAFRFNQPTRIEDPRSKVTTATYDYSARVVKTVAPLGDSTVYVYSANRNNPHPTQVTYYSKDPDGQEFSVSQTIAYEPTYFRVDSIVSSHAATQKFSYTGPVLDSVRVEADLTHYRFETRADLTSTGRLERVTDPRGHLTVFGFEPASFRNTSSVTDPQLRVTQYAHDAYGRVRQVTDPASRVFTTEYDPLNRVTRSIAPESTIVRYGYDDAQRVYTVTDPKEQLYTTRTNVLGWTESQTDPRGKTESFAYDVHGNVTRYTNRRGQVIRSVYDAFDRITSQEQVSEGKSTTWGYDQADLWVAVQNEESTDTVHLDQGGRLKQLASIRAGQRFTQNTYYDYAGRPSLLLVAGSQFSRRQGLGYDSRGRIDEISLGTNPPGVLTTDLSYDKDGLMDAVYFPRPDPRSTIFIPATAGHRPQEINYTDYLGSSYGDPKAIRFLRRYGYDVLERVDSITRPLETGDEIRVLSYDSLGRLQAYTDVQTSGPVLNESYSYDKAGNRLDHNAVVETGNRLTQYATYTLSYDDDGNITRKVKADGSVDQILSWNSLGQLTQVLSGTSTITYGYDGLGRRVRKTVDGVITRYLHDGDHLVLELDSYGNTLREYSYYPGVDFPHALRTGTSNSWYQYVSELPGHVAALVDANEQVVNSYRYDPFGRIQQISEQVEQPLRYGAREYDAETGLYFHRARYYDAELQRFISEDPIGFEGGINPYLYAGDDPVNARDPYGLKCYQTGYQAGNFRVYCDDLAGGGLRPRAGFGLYWPSWDYEYEEEDYADDAIDVGVGFVPGLSTLHDLSVAATGYNAITGERVGAGGRLIAFAGMVTPFSGGQFRGAGKLLASGLGNVHGGRVTADVALLAAGKWLGSGYREIAPGVFRSADNARQFRMQSISDLSHRSPHVHFEAIGSNGRDIMENSHVYLIP